jgi:hypothetical protein
VGTLACLQGGREGLGTRLGGVGLTKRAKGPWGEGGGTCQREGCRPSAGPPPESSPRHSPPSEGRGEGLGTGLGGVGATMRSEAEEGFPVKYISSQNRFKGQTV